MCAGEKSSFIEAWSHQIEGYAPRKIQTHQVAPLAEYGWNLRLIRRIVLFWINKQKKNRQQKHVGPVVVTPMYGTKETKITSVSPSWSSVGTSVLYSAPLANIAAGADTHSRLGRRIRVKRIAFLGIFEGAQTNSVADDPNSTMRMIVVNSLSSFTFTTTPSITTFIDPRYQPGLKRVLYDQTRTLNVYGKDSVGYISVAEPWGFSIDVDIPIEYASAAASAPTTSDIKICVVSDSAAIVNPGFREPFILVEFVDDV
jgi:hypothetical protein